MLRIYSVVIFAALLTSSAGVYAADANVALNKPVTLNGAYPVYQYPLSNLCGSAPPQAAAATLVDGVFLPELTCYQSGSVYWDAAGNSIDINLSGTFLLSAAIVQADDNDTYTLQYRDTAGVYHDWWSVPTAGTFGLITRPNSADQTQRQSLPSVLATGLRFLAPAGSGDGEYAVSEIQAFGSPVSVVDIGANLVNPLFAGTSGSCPTGWICAGSPDPGFASYAPTVAQYPGGSPFPTSAFSPTIFGGSGTIRQITSSLTWIAGTTYVLNLWAGLPNTEPDGTTPVEAWASAARLYLTTGAGEQVAAFDIPSPPHGAFAANPIVFTLPADSPFVGQQVGVLIFVSAPSLFSANFAVTPVAP